MRKDNNKNDDSIFSMMSCGARSSAPKENLTMPREILGIRNFEGIDLRSEEYEEFRNYMKTCCDGNKD